MKRILIIDDDPDLVALNQARLKMNGYQVLTAGNGEEGLKKTLSEKPDLILLDIKMPVMDGYGFLVAFKEYKAINESVANIPVIVLTAYVEYRVKELLEREEIVAYMRKPFEAEKLLSVIAEALKG